MPMNCFFRDMFRAEMLLFQFRRQPAEGVPQFRSSAVIQGQREGGAGVARSLRLHPANLVLDVGSELMRPPDSPEANIVVVHPLDVSFEVGLQKAHEEADLGARPSQVVFQRERVKRQPGQADARRRFRYELYSFSPLLMPQKSFE